MRCGIDVSLYNQVQQRAVDREGVRCTAGSISHGCDTVCDVLMMQQALDVHTAPGMEREIYYNRIVTE